MYLLQHVVKSKISIKVMQFKMKSPVIDFTWKQRKKADNSSIFPESSTWVQCKCFQRTGNSSYFVNQFEVNIDFHCFTSFQLPSIIDGAGTSHMGHITYIDIKALFSYEMFTDFRRLFWHFIFKSIHK